MLPFVAWTWKGRRPRTCEVFSIMGLVLKGSTIAVRARSASAGAGAQRRSLKWRRSWSRCSLPAASHGAVAYLSKPPPLPGGRSWGLALNSVAVIAIADIRIGVVNATITHTGLLIPLDGHHRGDSSTPSLVDRVIDRVVDCPAGRLCRGIKVAAAPLLAA